MPELLRCAAIPCGSCPYRRDVASGIWDETEYHKLPAYDGSTWEQPTAVFLCHQGDGCLCAGWVGCHDARHLLAFRMQAARIDPMVFDYESPAPLFASGAEACRHGLAEFEDPGEQAQRVIRGLRKKRTRVRGGPDAQA